MNIKTLIILGTFFLSACATSRPAKNMSISEIKNKYPDISQEWATSIKEGKIEIGMTKQMVIDTKGKPANTSKVTTENGVTEKWTYGKVEGLMTIKADYIFFQDGKVTAIEEN